MQKPQKSDGVEVMVQVGYDFHEVIDFINEKYNINAYDLLDSFSHFDKWADAKGYGDKDPDGEKRSSSRIWYAEYQTDPQGEAMRPEYQDFIGWFIDEYTYTYDESFEVNIDYHLKQNIPDFVRTILGYIKQEFGSNVEFYYVEG